MKKVFNNNELAAVWVARSQDEGRSPGERMYFTGDTIYSYGPHFPIARFFTAPNGEEVVLFTTQNHSNTTNRHMRIVQSAVNRAGYRVVYCGDVGGFIAHDSNLRQFQIELERAAVKHDKARKPQLYKGGIMHQCKLAREYCEVMCIPVPSWAQLPDNIEAGKPLTAAMRVHTEEVNHV